MSSISSCHDGLRALAVTRGGRAYYINSGGDPSGLCVQEVLALADHPVHAVAQGSNIGIVVDGQGTPLVNSELLAVECAWSPLKDAVLIYENNAVVGERFLPGWQPVSMISPSTYCKVTKCLGR